MRKFILLILIVLGTITCSNNNNSKIIVGNGESQNSITYQISNPTVFSTVPEQVENSSFNTINTKKGFITSKFISNLGKFQKAKNFDLNLQITRQTENPLFEVGSFNLAGPEVILESLISPKDTTFAVVNAISIKEYTIQKSLGNLNQLKGKFVFYENLNNKLIIEKVKDIKELENVPGNFKVGSQQLEGYALIHLMEINSNEIFSIKLDFSVINDVKIRM
ncbi:hypothetical protein [Kordia sp.]|uniref:hypothetical protein n=1 Tax=Kordia sp. TaxID=1965332 RepID=UPI003D2B0100